MSTPLYRCPACGRPTVHTRATGDSRLAAACSECSWVTDDARSLQRVRERLSRLEKARIIGEIRRGW